MDVSTFVYDFSPPITCQAWPAGATHWQAPRRFFGIQPRNPGALEVWTAVQQLTVTNGLAYFSDPQWTNFSRVLLPHPLAALSKIREIRKDGGRLTLPRLWVLYWFLKRKLSF
ncbi:MAG TPA: hypothetical protein VGO59_11015 [Verrucomicrobiae bacterium]